MNITLKNVPEAVYRVMKRLEKEQGLSLNAQIIRALESETIEVERRRRLAVARKDLARFAASLPSMDDSTLLIRQDRER